MIPTRRFGELLDHHLQPDDDDSFSQEELDEREAAREQGEIDNAENQADYDDICGEFYDGT